MLSRNLWHGHLRCNGGGSCRRRSACCDLLGLIVISGFLGLGSRWWREGGRHRFVLARQTCRSAHLRREEDDESKNARQERKQGCGRPSASEKNTAIFLSLDRKGSC